APARRNRVQRPEGFHALGREPVMSREVNELSVESEDVTELGLAEPRGAPRYGVEHGLHVGWRARYDAQDFAGRGLLLQSFRKGRPALSIGGGLLGLCFRTRARHTAWP